MDGDSPYQSARRAWSRLTHLLPRLREYVANPTAPEDQGHQWPSLIAEIDAALERLHAADDLLVAGPDNEAPPPPLMDVLRSAEGVATKVQIVTFIKHVDNPEPDLIDVRRMIGDANRTDH